MIKAAVFDMDGLMFDTERVGRDAWNHVGEALGFGNLGAVNERCLGCNKEHCREIFREFFGEALTLDRVLELAAPNRLLSALKAKGTGAAKASAAFSTGFRSMPTK